MRPIERGTPPVDENGKPILFQRYQDAKKYLIERLGKFCSYCEMKLETNLAVEHVQPKGNLQTAGLQNTWNNFLLACPICNSIKGHTEINEKNIDDYLWPDRNNTFLALAYEDQGVVVANPQFPEIQDQANALITLVGLDRNPTNGVKPPDDRWFSRLETWNNAVDAKNDLSTRPNDKILRKHIARQASQYFSIWATVFADDPDMLRRIFENFKGNVENCGTALDCFDDRYKPVKRPGGRI